MSRRLSIVLLTFFCIIPANGFSGEPIRRATHRDRDVTARSGSDPQKEMQKNTQDLLEEDKFSSKLQFVLTHFFYTQTPLNLFKFLYPRSGDQRAGSRSSKAEVAEAKHEQTIKLETSREAFGRDEKKGNAPSSLHGNSLELAILQMVSEQPTRLRVRAEGFGRPVLPPGADPEAGRKLFLAYCQKCHGEDGRGPSERFNNGGKGIGPYGQRQPFLFLKVLPLNRLYAGGITPQFAERSAFGVHATLPDMSSAATLSHDAWADLQAFVASFDESQPSDYAVQK